MNAPTNVFIRGIAFALLLATTFWLVGCSDEAPNEPAVDADQAAQTAEVSRETTTDADAETAEPDSPASPPTGKSNLSTDLAISYEKKCPAVKEASLECEILRSLVIAEVVLALEEIEQARDQRGAEEALLALDLADEPEVHIAAMRILGQFPETPGIAVKTLPLLLDSPWLAVQEMAANLLSRNPDPEYSALGSLWSGNHNGLYPEDEYEEYPDFAPHYPDMAFPAYPNAEWFSPADSDRTVGWWTADEMEEVIDWLSDKLDVEPLSYTQWSEQSTAQSMAAFQSIDQTKLDRVQQLTEEFTKTQDMALLEQMQKLQEEIYAPMQAAGKVSEMGVDNVALPSMSGVFETVQYFIAEEKDGHVARLIIVYPLPSLERTVIQEAWNLIDYPNAWPTP